ncbi:MAG TPA: SRPBCC family protein [Vicinamibacterales bacterium]|nr:SRPBCC family protein [Vicinamibacterales bacterium]
MHTLTLHDRKISLANVKTWMALGTGALLLLAASRRRSATGACLALSSIPLFYRGVTGRWPGGLTGSRERDDTKTALGGERGIHVRESVRLEVPVAVVYRFWRRLENLPRFMTHLDRVTETRDGRSHWVAAGPAGVVVEWDAEVLNDIENELLAWASLPGSDVATAGSVCFEPARDGQSTQVTVHLQYSPPGGKVGALVASLFGREPTQTVREDLRRFKELLEAGENTGQRVEPGETHELRAPHR